MAKKRIKKNSAAPKLKVAVGTAMVETLGYVSKSTVKDLARTMSEYDPSSNSLSFNVSKNGFNCRLGKNFSTKNVACFAGAVAFTVYGIKYVCKALFRKLTESKNPIKDADYEEIKEPVAETVDEIREKAAVTSVNYDDHQLIGKFLYKGDKAILYAPPGTGKTVLALQMARDICLGEVSLIAPEDKGIHMPETVIYYDGEQNEVDYVKIFGITDVSKLSNLQIIRGFFFKEISKWLEDVQKRLNGLVNATVFLDNIASVCSSVNLEIIRKLFLLQLKQIQEEAEKRGGIVTFVIIAHTNKQFQLAGSSNIRNFATTVLGLEKYDENNILLRVDKMRKYGDLQGKDFLLAKRCSPDDYKHFAYVRELSEQSNGNTIATADQKKAERKKKYEEVNILRTTNPEMGWEEIKKKTGISKQCFQNYKNEFE